jgi:eukaryotic-like serine/threonine-protein kinase
MKECQLCKTCFADDVATCPNDGMPTMHTIAGEPVLEGKYHIESRLGQGGMGVVYKARHAYLKTQLAIKIILPDLVGNDPQLVTRFRQEALAAAAIRHQNVVAVTDYGVIQGAIPFLVMEYVEGESLHDLLAREKRLSPERALELMAAICAGVGAAHHQGIVHRDLKPLNIMICSDKPHISQAVKILDFGLAKIKSGELLGSFIQAQTTGLMGSPYYMAPEQWADDDPDSRSDIYSLGVMLYQMLAGDVPFKGSSIPAIMKKHISDPPPKFAELGQNIPPEIEAAVFHTLEKEKEKRTATVEDMIQEFRDAIYPPGIGIHTTSGGTKPVSKVNIHSDPSEAMVFIDNVAVGQTRDDGWITLNGMQTGSHNIRISKEGYEDWYGDILCDGQPKQVVAELRSAREAIPKPPAETIAYSGGISPNTPSGFSNTRDNAAEVQKTSVQMWDTGRQEIGVESQPVKRSILSPAVIGVAAVLFFVILGGVGIGSAFMLGLIPWGDSRSSVNDNSATPSPSPVESPGLKYKADLAEIPGGTFTMGSNDSSGEFDKPEHQVTVESFWMDKTEVTNGEFHEFMVDSKYKPTSNEAFLVHWVNDAPKPGEEMMPVRFVNIADVEAFAAWRSKRDGVTYRLPTEKEWEYAARNGSKNDRYPWGDSFRTGCAVVDQSNNDPMPVGSRSCPNDWGVHDLIGNVIEWTADDPWVYPGSESGLNEEELAKTPVKMIRGGSARYPSTGKAAVTATGRLWSPVANRHDVIGFRLVR